MTSLIDGRRICLPCLNYNMIITFLKSDLFKIIWVQENHTVGEDVGKKNISMVLFNL